MSVLSPGYLHSSFKLLEMIAKREHQLSVLASALPRIEVLPAGQVVNFAIGLGWVGADNEGRAAMTASGALIHKMSSASERIRQALLDFIGIIQPAWAQLTPRGRHETLSALSPEIRQCFAEAGLIVGYADEVVGWWDALAARARGQKSQIMMETGRHGERLSIKYEQARTGKEPAWQAVESNLSGFDILSVVGATDYRKLPIEVKTTSGAIGHGSFYVSRNEWETGSTSDFYTFHLWAIGDGNPAIAVLDKADVAPHIPVNQGVGSWETVEIPFAAFAAAFSNQPSLCI